jgi:hypothetical protein
MATWYLQSSHKPSHETSEVVFAKNQIHFTQALSVAVASHHKVAI